MTGNEVDFYFQVHLLPSMDSGLQWRIAVHQSWNASAV